MARRRRRSNPDDEVTKVTCPACGKGLLDPSLAKAVKAAVEGHRAEAAGEESDPPQVVTEMLPRLPEK
jgi:hypothetical protein